MDGDWTTFDGLSAENTFEPEPAWGTKPAAKPAAADGWAVPRAVAKRKPTPTKKGHAGVSQMNKAIKKKKAPRFAGLMKNYDEVDEEDENVPVRALS